MDADIMNEEIIKRKKRLSSFQIIILGFAGVILLGALLLMLPIATKERVVTPFHETLFTATSATCVTGLVVQDTGSYWSVFGQAILLFLIQIGGLGVVTVAAAFTMLSGKKISLMQRSTMQEAISAPQVGGIVRLTGFILKGTFLIELVGALCLMPLFVKDFGVKGIWYAFFHSVSAFCNGGFDLLGTSDNRVVSLTGYAGNVPVNVIIMLLILLGGLGFLTWEDIYTKKIHFKKYRLQSKIILAASIFLLVLPAAFFFAFEFTDMPLKERLLCSLFQTVTPRTAGFNTADLAGMQGASKAVMIVLMLIGGAPGSTAGGMKITTLAVLVTNMRSVFRQKEDMQFFGRRIEDGAVKTAAAVLSLYLTLFAGGAIAISMAEGLPLGDCLFETASAVATVGVTLGITPELGIFSQIILIMLMFMGRVGCLTLIYAAVSGGNKNFSRLPQEKVMVG